MWEKGKLGNPKGRPRKGNTMTEALTEHVDKDELAAVLYRLALEGNVAAIKYIYDRSEGTPQQHLHVEDERDDPLRDLLIDAFGAKSVPEEDSSTLGDDESEALDTRGRRTF